MMSRYLSICAGSVPVPWMTMSALRRPLGGRGTLAMVGMSIMVGRPSVGRPFTCSTFGTLCAGMLDLR